MNTVKRFLKIVGKMIGVCALLFFLYISPFIYWLTCDLINSSTAENPDKIASKAHFDLPSYTIIKQEIEDDPIARLLKNSMAPPSCILSYYWEIQLDGPLSEKDIKKLNRLVKRDSHWDIDGDYYRYNYQSSILDNDITIKIDVSSRIIFFNYSWAEQL